MSAGDVVPWAPFDLASVGELIAEPARTAILLSLMDASERPASELARIAHVTASTASEHLQRMVAGGLLATRAAGRNRFYRLANERVADAVESVARLQPLDQPRLHRLHADPKRRGLLFARTCYQHLAGTLGVALCDSLRARGYVRHADGKLSLEDIGARELAALGLETTERARVGKPCLDWTERRDHIGGPLGVALTRFLIERGWLRRQPQSRALRLSVAGEAAFVEHFGVEHHWIHASGEASTFVSTAPSSRR